MGAPAVNIEDLIPKRAMGEHNNINELQNYVVGLAPGGLALTGQLEDGTRPVPAFWRQGFRTFPGRVINELFTTTQPEAPLADTTTQPEEKH